VGIALCRQLAYTPPLAVGLATLAWIRQATGDLAGALKAMSEAGQAAPGPPGLLNPVPAQRARLLLAQGDLAAAARWVTERGLGPDDEPDYRRTGPASWQQPPLPLDARDPDIVHAHQITLHTSGSGPLTGQGGHHASSDAATARRRARPRDDR